MQRSKTSAALFLFAVLAMGSISWVMAGQDSGRKVMPFEGQVKSVKIDKCGLQPGTCEGSLVLARRDGGEVTVSVMPGTWIRRGDNLVTIDELGVGNYIKVQAIEIPGESIPRAWFIDGGDS